MFNIDNQKTAIIIPSYNPTHILNEVVTALLEKGFSIVVVDDGSSIDTKSIFTSLPQGIHLVTLDDNFGKGVALKSGFKYVKENLNDIEILVTADGDGQHSIEDIVRINEVVKEKSAPVFGTRQLNTNIPLRSKIGNDMSKISRAMITNEYLKDDQCGLRGFPRRYINKLINIKGYKYEYEMSVICVFEKENISIYSLPVQTIYLDENKESHFRPVLDTIRIQTSIFSYGGFVISSFVLAIVLSYFFTYIFSPELSIIAAITFAFAFSFVGEYFLFPYEKGKIGYRVGSNFLLLGIKMTFGICFFELLYRVFHFNYFLCIAIIYTVSIPLHYFLIRILFLFKRTQLK